MRVREPGTGEMGRGIFEGKEQIRNVLFISFLRATAVSVLSVKGREGKTSRFGRMLIILHPAERASEGVRFPSDPARGTRGHTPPPPPFCYRHFASRLSPNCLPLPLSLLLSWFSKALFKRLCPRAAEIGNNRVVLRRAMKWKNMQSHYSSGSIGYML